MIETPFGFVFGRARMTIFAPFFRALFCALASVFGPRELALILGLALIAYGAQQIFPPAAAILPGAVFVYIAIAGLS
jgi:hypothetical protein